ncbi:MAG: SAM-dependent methyltransferase, partial [Bradyrhizobium sp.]|nr:SAM-dependent methyltransferase [Bradyrhizobium sp.]
MNAGHPQNADQIAYWNGPGGQRWASRQAAQDIVLQPVLDLLIDRAAPKAGERVVDVGCGSGASSFALAAKVVPAGHVL